jgi:protein-tyrosine phosphatase
MAAAILRARALDAGVPLEVGSAGTGGWHTGSAAHPETRRQLAAHGLESDHRARVFGAHEFEVWDLVLAMDRTNEQTLRTMAPTPDDRTRIRLIRSFDPGAPDGAEVPDPYDDGPDRYGEVFEMLDAACRGVVAHVRLIGSTAGAR